MNQRPFCATVAQALSILLGALVSDLLPASQGLCVERGAVIPADSESSAEFEKNVYRLVKDLEYSNQVARDFVNMIHLWKADGLFLKLARTADGVKQKKISGERYAEVEKQAVRELAHTIRKEIAGADTTIKGNLNYFDLALIIKDKKAHCLGYSQVFYVLGNSLGLNVEASDVEEYSFGRMPDSMGHVACLVGLHNGKAIQADLTLDNYVSEEFVFTDEYERKGDNWQLRKKDSRLNIHPMIQLLDRKGLVAYIYSNRGYALLKAGETSEAISSCNKAIELNPKCAMAYLNRSGAFDAIGKLAEAISDSTKAIEFRPGFAEAYYNRGTAYGKLGKLKEAISDYNKAIEHNPNDAETYDNRGNAFLLSGKANDAMSDYDKAIQLNPKNAKAYSNRGLVHSSLGQLDKAVLDNTKAIELDPNLDVAYLNRGKAYHRLGKLTEAIEDYNKAVQLNPQSGDAYNNRGSAYAQSGKLVQAIPDLSKAIDLNPNDADAYYKRGLANATLGKKEDAKRDLNNALRLNPSLKGQVKDISSLYKLDL